MANVAYLTQSQGTDLIKGALRQYILCEKGERVMLPKFGLGLGRYLFEPMDETLFELIKEDVATGIPAYFPFLRILSLNVSASGNYGEQNSLYIKLKVQVINTAEIFELSEVIS